MLKTVKMAVVKTVTPPKTNGWIPKMMVWNRWPPLKYGHFGIYVRFLGSKTRCAFVPNSKYWRLPRALLPILAMASHQFVPRGAREEKKTSHILGCPRKLVDA